MRACVHVPDNSPSFVRSLHHFDIYKQINLRHMMYKGQHICDEIIFLFILNDSCTSVKVFNAQSSRCQEEIVGLIW